MDVELQILKHLKRDARPTVSVIDQYYKWWEIIFSAYWMVSSHSQVFCDLNQSQALSTPKLRVEDSISDFNLHQQWSNQGGWKTTLNNLRLIIQPTVLFWMIVTWISSTHWYHESIFLLFALFA